MLRPHTALKTALVILVVSVLGSAIALTHGTTVMSIVDNVGFLWVSAAALLLPSIAPLWPTRLPQIAIGVALLAGVVGVLCIVHYSTQHVALSLSMIGFFWQLAANMLLGREWLLDKTLGGIYREFKAGNVKPPSPIARTLERGSLALFSAAIVCLFTITTW